MATGQMYECEEKKTFVQPDGSFQKRWVKIPVSKVIGIDKNKIRCCHCHGMVRVHIKKVEHGPEDHVEHLSKQDSEGCRGGMHFQGNHRLSLAPVEK